MARRRDIAPVISRPFTDEDNGVVVVAAPYNNVTFRPGAGDSGKLIEVVEYECPKCRFDRMVRVQDYRAFDDDWVEYWCLKPNCPHFVESELSAWM